MNRGDIYLAILDSTKGSEQAGTRPVLLYQHDRLIRAARTVVVIPFTTNLKMAQLPSCVQVSTGEGGLRQDSVALCHQIRVLDKAGLITKWGTLPEARVAHIDRVVLETLGLS